MYNIYLQSQHTFDKQPREILFGVTDINELMSLLPTVLSQITLKICSGDGTRYILSALSYDLCQLVATSSPKTQLLSFRIPMTSMPLQLNRSP